VTTLFAVLVGELAAGEILQLIYGSLADVPTRAALGAWALVTVFAVLCVLLVELLSRPDRRRARAGLPHPIRATRSLLRRIVRVKHPFVLAEPLVYVQAMLPVRESAFLS
jgi:hypothetical protein